MDDNEQRAGVTFTPVCPCGFRFISSVLEMRGRLGAEVEGMRGGGNAGVGEGMESASAALERP